MVRFLALPDKNQLHNFLAAKPEAISIPFISWIADQESIAVGEHRQVSFYYVPRSGACCPHARCMQPPTVKPDMHVLMYKVLSGICQELINFREQYGKPFHGDMLPTFSVFTHICIHRNSYRIAYPQPRGYVRSCVSCLSSWSSFDFLGPASTIPSSRSNHHNETARPRKLWACA